MSNVLLGIAVVLTAGTLMAGTPLSSTVLENLPHLATRLVADDHGGKAGGGASRSGPSERAGRSAEAGDDRGGRGEAEAGDDHGGRGEVEAGDDRGGRGEVEIGDDRGVDVNDLPDDSDALLIPFAN